jgi:hypothetical protein
MKVNYFKKSNRKVSTSIYNLHVQNLIKMYISNHILY